MNDKIARIVGKVVTTLILTGARTATAYVSPTHTVRACQRRIRGRVPRHPRRFDVNLTIGTPNYRSRQFIKKAQRAGEPFPIKRVQLTYVHVHARA